MANDVLIEIGMEEIPARFIRDAVEQLKDRTIKWLEETRIQHGQVDMFATPRRIAVRISALSGRQQDQNEEVRGPSRKIAIDADGQWSKAALGFARSQGIDPSELYFAEWNGTEYVFARKISIGLDTSQVLHEGLAQLIASLHFPKHMRWGSFDLRYVRPIRWIVALYGSEVIPMELAGVQSGRTTRGHRFLGSEVELKSPAQYVERLKEQFVYADMDERRQLILNQIKQLASEKQWNIAIEEELLEEVLFLVEYPTILFGTFDAAFLQIPQEVLITSMREHQRYFPVLDSSGQLLPYFVTIRNGDSASLDIVARGNEKVLRARLSDARFFYEEDQKLTIHEAVSKLESVVFHEELGTIGDKVRRIRRVAERLSKRLELDNRTSQLADRAAEICKFDLVTQMVYEFPELQGVMGEDYASKAGEPDEVARAVFEHYQPRYSGDAAPSSTVGAIVALADKIDTIVGCFSIGIIPTGSQDPYALRRLAAGIVQIIVSTGLRLNLSDLFEIALDVYSQTLPAKRTGADVRSDLDDFFALRVKNAMPDSVRYDVVEAVMSVGFDDVHSVLRRAEALMDRIKEDSGFKAITESFNRVSNLADKAASDRINPSGLIEQEEHALYAAWSANRDLYRASLLAGSEQAALAALSEWKEPITAFFDRVMVMVDDPKVRDNRLAMLAGIASDLSMFADFRKIVWA